MDINPFDRVRRLRAAKPKANLGVSVDRQRVPPGQWVTERWPVLHYGPVPDVDLDTWDFQVFGLVDEAPSRPPFRGVRRDGKSPPFREVRRDGASEQPLRLTYAQFMALPKVQVKADIHCVTRWTLLDSVWEGVAFKELMKLIRPKPEARFVLVHCEYGFTTNLPLDVLLDDDVLFATKRNGEDITPDHGWPLRLIVPKKYFWKSAKWVRGLEFLAQDRLGFWEQAGYHNNADPWKEERFAD
jgi:DMSO/TMAO reductase YedYZ molybdopterin-dependent catalytic subunit